MSDTARAQRFASVALPHLDAAYGFARRLTRNESEAQDVTQEAFLRAWRYFETFRGTDARPWLLSIVRNTFMSQRQARGAPMADLENADTALDTVLAGTEALASIPQTPEKALLEADARRSVMAALDTLPQTAREVLVLREIEDLSYKRIATILDVPIGTVMSRLARARAALAAEIRRRAEDG